MKINWIDRTVPIMKLISRYHKMRESAKLLQDEFPIGATLLVNSCNKKIKYLDNKLVKILKPQLTGVTVAGEITQTDIDMANNHPIENLFPEAKRGKVLCPFHNDRNPSATINKHNRLKCWSACGKSFSVIDCYMRLNNCSFREAVLRLK